MKEKFLCYIDRQQVMTPEKLNQIRERWKDYTKEDLEDLIDNVRFMAMTEEEAANYKE